MAKNGQNLVKMVISDALTLIKESLFGFKLLGPWTQVLDLDSG